MEDFAKKQDGESADQNDLSNEEIKNDLNEEDDWDTDGEDQEPIYVICPCCDTGFTELPPDCDHILIEYDASFREFSCDYFFDRLDDLKEGMLELLAFGKKVTTDDKNLQAIWDYAEECHLADPSKVELDADIFMDFLSAKAEDLGAHKCYMNEEDGAPGYSSSYVYYFAEDPDVFIEAVTEYVLEQLKTN
jgi:hypothetical protein